MKIYIKKTLTASFETLETEADALGKGGQAWVYKIKTSAYKDFCLKKYIKDIDAKKSFDRIAYMIKNPPQSSMDNNSFRICWPTAFAYDENKNFIGYLMPLAFPKSRDLKILEVYNAKPISEQMKYKKYPEWFNKYELNTDIGLKNRMKMMHNWAVALHCLHETNRYVIVDLKPENVMATATGKISVVDTDSFQISENGRILYPGPVYTPNYFPPEGRMLHDSNKPFTVSCDCFSAAVCFYSIFVGVHPYAGVIAKAPYDKLETIPDCINAGLYAFGAKKNFLSFPAGLNLHKHFENLPPSVQNLFGRAFGVNPADRPNMLEWAKALRETATSSSNLIRAKVAPPKQNTIKLEIQKVEFRDEDYDCNVRRDFGKPLYTDIQYLTPRITARCIGGARDITLNYRLYSPSGDFIEGSSKPGFSSSLKLSFNGGGVETIRGIGFGNDKGTLYKEPGMWRVEYYEGDKCIYKTTFMVNSLAPKSTTSSRPVPTVGSPTTTTTRSMVTPPPTRPTTGGGKRTGGGGGKGGGCLKTILWLLFIGGLLFAAYWFFGRPMLEEKVETEDMYVYADGVEVRNTYAGKSDVVAVLPYGSKVKVLSDDLSDNIVEIECGDIQGFVSSNLLLPQYRFDLLNGALDKNSISMVQAAKYRLMLLDFIEYHGMNTGKGGWMLISQEKDESPGEVYYDDAMSKAYTECPEVAFVLVNTSTGAIKAGAYAWGNDRPVQLASEDVDRLHILNVKAKGDTYKINCGAAVPKRSQRNIDNVNWCQDRAKSYGEVLADDKSASKSSGSKKSSGSSKLMKTNAARTR